MAVADTCIQRQIHCFGIFSDIVANVGITVDAYQSIMLLGGLGKLAAQRLASRSHYKRTVVQFNCLVVLLGGQYYLFNIYRKSGISGMNDNMHIGIFNRRNHSLSIFLNASAAITGFIMEPGQNDVQVIRHHYFRHINITLQIKDIGLYAAQHLDPLHHPGQRNQIGKVVPVGSTRHFKAMVGNRDHFQAFLAGYIRDFFNGTVTVAARGRMNV